ncbi:phage GP46 family protein [Deltaproteobacteria bacterium OttesenSCG-928-M10]|nr:phage GP46 family protein [Deltaproteobacteria bacterium OttesenSCG-928-M10]
MTDLALLFTEHGDFDLVIENRDFLGDEGLQTAVTVSLFTDRVARADDPLPEYLPGQKSDRRGWWGDLSRENGRSRPIGSRLWLLFREKELPETVRRAREYAAESLAWLAAAGGAYAVEAFDDRPGRLRLEIEAAGPGPTERSSRWTAFLTYAEPRRVELLGRRF